MNFLSSLKYWLPKFGYGFIKPCYLDNYANELYVIHCRSKDLIFEADYFTHTILIYRGVLWRYFDKRIDSCYLPFNYKGIKIIYRKTL